MTRLDAAGLAWATEVARMSGYHAGRDEAQAETLAAWRSVRLRTLRYAYDLHAARAVAWATEAEGWDSGDVDDADKLRARRRMTLHQRAVGRIGRLVLGLPAFKVTK